MLLFQGEDHGGELALYLLHLVAVSVPVKQVGAGGHRGEVKGGSGVRVGKILEISTEIKETQICKAVVHRVNQLVNRKNIFFGRK